MDGSRFDNMARALRSGAPRREVIGLLAGGALGLMAFGEHHAEAGGKGGGKGNGKGKGKGKKKKDKKPNTCMTAAAVCSQKKCGMGDDCCSRVDCDCRQGLVCNYSSGDSESGTCGCLPTEVMHNGRCGTKPACIPAGSRYDPATQICCSGTSHKEGPVGARYDVCDPGFLVCLSDADCIGSSCRGYDCLPIQADCGSLFY